MISAVVLAAGRALPAGEPSSFSLLQNKPALQGVLESALASAVAEVICVTDDLAAARREIKLWDRRLLWHWHPSGGGGQSSSMIAGLWSSHPESDGVLILAGAIPFLSKDLINALIERFTDSTAWIVAASFRGQPADPVLFRRDLFPELLDLAGDDYGHSLLQKHAKKTFLIKWPAEDSHVNGERQRSSELWKQPV